MRALTCIVCESSGDWAAALRTAWARRSTATAGGAEPASVIELQLVETRSPDECRRQWRDRRRQAGATPILVELTGANGTTACDLLADHAWEMEETPRFVVVTPESVEYESAAREAGAVDVVTSARALRRVVEALTRYAERVDEPPPRTLDAEPSLREQITAALPWAGYARPLDTKP